MHYLDRTKLETELSFLHEVQASLSQDEIPESRIDDILTGSTQRLLGLLQPHEVLCNIAGSLSITSTISCFTEGKGSYYIDATSSEVSASGWFGGIALSESKPNFIMLIFDGTTRDPRAHDIFYRTVHAKLQGLTINPQKLSNPRDN